MKRPIKSYKHPTLLSPFSDEEAAKICLASDDYFAKDISKKFPSVSPEQLYWIHRLAMDMNKMLGQGGCKVITELFGRALESGLKYPRIEIGDLTLYYARTKHISVHWMGGLVGVIKEEWCHSICEDPVFWNSLHQFCEDPVKYGACYGQETGCCCFCGRELTTLESRSVGYGPICAKRWGLPWGEVDALARYKDLKKKLERAENGF